MRWLWPHHCLGHSYLIHIMMCMPTWHIDSFLGPSSSIMYGKVKQGQLAQSLNLRCAWFTLFDISQGIIVYVYLEFWVKQVVTKVFCGSLFSTISSSFAKLWLHIYLSYGCKDQLAWNLLVSSCWDSMAHNLCDEASVPTEVLY